MSVPANLRDAYQRTTYRVDAPHRSFPLRIGERHPEFDGWLRSAGIEKWAFVTAWNPRSVVLADAENEQRHEELREAIATLGHPAWPGEGVGDDPAWRPERSLLIGGISESAAVQIAIRFDQHAIVVGRVGGPATLVFAAMPA